MSNQSPQLERTITSLAILKVNWEKGHDYIENFVPIVAECLRHAAQDEVSLPELRDVIIEHFGLRIPQGALKTILQRVQKRGYVKQQRQILKRDNAALAKVNIAEVRADVLRQYEALIRKLISFCKDRYQIDWSKEEAESTILSYLEEHSTPVLSTIVTARPISARNGRGKRAEYLLNAFISDLCTADPEGFRFLETILKGSMLANVFYFRDISKAQQHFKGVEVYFDSKFLLQALGYAGESLQAPCQELMSLLYQEGAKLRCFQHTQEEMMRVLLSAARALRSRALMRHTYGDVIEHFIRSGYKSSDVELLALRLPKSLRALSVEIKRKPPYSRSLGLDESKLESMLRENIPYSTDRAVLHDTDSIAAIHRLRRGRFPLDLESCDALFVTTNYALVKYSLLFFREEYPDVEIAVPPCIRDHHLTTLVWLKKPLQAPELPRKRIIADCYAAMNPPDALWRLYLEEADRLREDGRISEDEYYLLRYSTEARTILMDITQGDTEAFVEGTVAEVLERARAAVRAETEAALQAEVRRRQEAEAIASGAMAKLQAQRDRLRILGARAGRWVAMILKPLGVMSLCLGTYLTVPRPFPPVPQRVATLIAPLIFLILAGITIGNLVCGVTLNSLMRRLEKRVSQCVEHLLARILIGKEVPDNDRVRRS